MSFYISKIKFIWHVCEPNMKWNWNPIPDRFQFQFQFHQKHSYEPNAAIVSFNEETSSRIPRIALKFWWIVSSWDSQPWTHLWSWCKSSCKASKRGLLNIRMLIFGEKLTTRCNKNLEDQDGSQRDKSLCPSESSKVKEVNISSSQSQSLVQLVSGC